MAQRHTEQVEQALDRERRRSAVARLLATLERPTYVSVQEGLRQLGWAVHETTVRRDIARVREEWRESRVTNLSEYMDRTLAELNAVISDCRRAISGGFRETTTVRRKHVQAMAADGAPLAGMVMAEEIRITNPPQPNTAAMATAVRALEHRDRLMGLLDAELMGQVRESGSGRVFAFTLRLGSRLAPSLSTPQDVVDVLPADVESDSRAIVRVGDDGKHSTPN